MMLRKWDCLPDEFKTDEVREYYDALSKRKLSLIMKRAFDILFSILLLIPLLPVFLVLAAVIKADSKGPVFYRQVRVTQYGRKYRIFKFRTMIPDADRKGTLVTVGNDSRITRVGSFLRRVRMDELPQILNVLGGSMTFVGTRPEVPRYVDKYTPEMMATLLLPAGVTSLASIYYKDEAKLLDGAEDADAVYVGKVLPEKMKYNQKAVKSFSFFGDIRIMFMTVAAMLGKDYGEDKDSSDKKKHKGTEKENNTSEEK